MRHLLLLLSLLPATTTAAQPVRPHRQVVAPPAQPQKLRVYLLLGQSNMAGRGTVAAQDTVPDRRVLRLNAAGQWEVAQDPLHFDKPVAGVGPGLAFGRAMARQSPDTNLVIGLVPCAVGGTSLADWQPGAYFADTRTHPYDDALARARVALRSGTLAGIIWHQGEADSSPEKSATYATRLAAFVARLRTDLGTPALPFVAGELPQFAQGTLAPANVAAVNAALAELVGTVPAYAVVPATGSTDQGDHLHLDADSARRLGARYAVAMQRLQATAPRVGRRPSSQN